MKLGILVPLQRHATAEFVRTYGEMSEELGFDSLWIGEHIVITDDYATQFPIASVNDGKMKHDDPCDNIELDIYTSLAFLAAVTKKIRIGSATCVLPQRNPVYSAKEVANVDVLSNGRLDWGVGMGWLEEEFAVAGAPFERRGARTDAYMEVIKRLWCDEVSEYHGEFYDLPACRFYPKPLQKPHPPIIFAGKGEKSFRRVATACQGWMTIGYGPEGVASQVKELEAIMEEVGRPREDVTIYASPFGVEYDHKTIEQYKAAGVDHLILLEMTHTVDGLKQILAEKAEAYLDFCHALD